MEQKENKEIIYRINNSKINEINLHYGDAYTDNEFILKIERMYYYRFIDVIEPGGFRYYNQLIILKGLLNIIIPIIDTNKNHIFLDYNYYTKVHKTNNSLQLINKKYIIDLELIKLLNISEYDMENKDICLDINIAYNYRVD